MADRLKERARKRIIEEMIRSVRPSSGWKVLIVDHNSMRTISASCRMFDIMEEGVSLVENIDIARQPLPTMEAIYFLSPNSKSIDLMINDFKDPKQPQYAHIHLFFTNRISDDDLKKIKASPALSRIKCLKEMNIDFLAYESQVFHFDSNDSFRTLFSPDVASRGAELRSIADKIASVCATLNDYPTIRYIGNKESGGSTHTIATLVAEKLDSIMKSSTEYANNAQISTNRATLIILDRTVDPIAPILHEFTYQAMVYDLLKIENDRYSFQITTQGGDSKNKEVILSELDPIYPTLRHMHIAETMNWLLDNFNQFMKENKASKVVTGGKVQTLKEMGDAMKAMPQYQEMLGKYSLHINMASSAMNIFQAQQLTKIAGLEQDMATGEDTEGRTVKNVISSIAPLLSDPEIKAADKIRLIMLFIISQEGIKDSDRKRLMDMAKISFEDQACISNLKYLGVTLLKATRAAPKKKDKEKKRKNRDDAPAYDLSRYIPSIKSIGEGLIDGSLSTTEYPFAREGSDMGKDDSSKQATVMRKSVQPKWANENSKKDKKSATTTIGGRIIIFVAGGITYSEIRTAYELTTKHNREVLIGSTSILTPQIFIDNLSSLKKLEKAEVEG